MKQIRLILQLKLCVATLMTLQGSDTVTYIFKCNSYNTIKSLCLLKNKLGGPVIPGSVLRQVGKKLNMLT